MEARWERLADPDAVLSPRERARRAESLRKAHYRKMAQKSAESRARKQAKLAKEPKTERLSERPADPFARIALLERREEQLLQRLADVQGGYVDDVIAAAVDETFSPVGYFVYLLWGDDEVRPVYIGKSTNVLARVGNHMSSPRMRGLVKRIQFVRCRDQSVMDATEGWLIDRYRPQLNIGGIPASG
jgi:hypothetical protein